MLDLYCTMGCGLRCGLLLLLNLVDMGGCAVHVEGFVVCIVGKMAQDVRMA